MLGIKHVTSTSSCNRLHGWFYERNEETHELYIEIQVRGYSQRNSF